LEKENEQCPQLKGLDSKAVVVAANSSVKLIELRDDPHPEAIVGIVVVGTERDGREGINPDVGRERRRTSRADTTVSV
jgi:hypothetical protein